MPDTAAGQNVDTVDSPGAARPGAARPSRKGLVLAGVLLLVLAAAVAGGVGAAGLLLGAPAPDEKARESAPAAKAAPAAKPVARVVYDKFQELYVNVRGSNMRRFLVVKLTLVFRDEQVKSSFVEREMVAQHALITMLKSQTIEDLDQPDVTNTLGQRTRDLLNSTLKLEGGLEDVYFTRFVVQ